MVLAVSPWLPCGYDYFLIENNERFMSSPTTVEDDTTSNGIQKAPPRWLISIRLMIIQLGAVAALVFFPLNWNLFLLFVISYVIRMFGSEGVYHRYFSHRAYRANRVVQFFLTLIGVSSGQRGPLWWAWTHHVHHKNADREGDPHSPVVDSWRRAHVGWYMDPKYIDTDLDLVRYFAKFPEVRWLNLHYMTVFFGIAGLLFLAGYYGMLGEGVSGMAAVCWGAFLPATLGVQLTALVNSAAHGKRFPGGIRRYETEDASLNRPILAFLTLGMGWHNNHHRYASAGRAGFAWYEIDVSYYILRVLEILGLIHDLRRVPDRIRVEGGLHASKAKPPNQTDSH